jgi:vanillate/3-O-methylgallate O-demethylase
MSREELDAVDYDLAEHFCSPAELGWAHTVSFKDHRFLGRDALLREAESGGPARRLVGLVWNSDDMAALYAAQFRDAPAPPPSDLPYGQFRILFLKVLQGGDQVGWASGIAYSPNLRRMISLARLRRDLEPGAEVRVVWGGFSSEPSCEIRAAVAALPLIEQQRRADLAPAAR